MNEIAVLHVTISTLSTPQPLLTHIPPLHPNRSLVRIFVYDRHAKRPFCVQTKYVNNKNNNNCHITIITPRALRRRHGPFPSRFWRINIYTFVVLHVVISLMVFSYIGQRIAGLNKLLSLCSHNTYPFRTHARVRPRPGELVVRPAIRAARFQRSDQSKLFSSDSTTQRVRMCCILLCAYLARSNEILPEKMCSWDLFSCVLGSCSARDKLSLHALRYADERCALIENVLVYDGI